MAAEPKAAQPRAAQAKASSRRVAATLPLEDEAPARNYALEVIDATEDNTELMVPSPRPRGFARAAAQGVEPSQAASEPEDSFALRLTQALEAISSAQADTTGESGAGRDVVAQSTAPNGNKAPAAPRARAKLSRADAAATVEADYAGGVTAHAGDLDDEAISIAQLDAARGEQPALAVAGRPSLAAWLAALDKLPPIKLPVGPAVPWRVGLPALVAVVAIMAFVGRPSDTARAEDQVVRLPAQETYAVQRDAPLFAQAAQNPGAIADATPVSADSAPPAAQATPVAAQPIGVAEPAGMGFDVLDVGLKLAAVLGLAYGSLMLLKRTGLGGAGMLGKSNTVQGMRVTSTLALAPNRSVHVLQVPGGRTLLVGATPTAVNLLAELHDDEAE